MRPRASVQNQQTKELIGIQKTITQTQQQKPESQAWVFVVMLVWLFFSAKELPCFLIHNRLQLFLMTGFITGRYVHVCCHSLIVNSGIFPRLFCFFSHIFQCLWHMSSTLSVHSVYFQGHGEKPSSCIFPIWMQVSWMFCAACVSFFAWPVFCFHIVVVIVLLLSICSYHWCNLLHIVGSIRLERLQRRPLLMTSIRPKLWKLWWDWWNTSTCWWVTRQRWGLKTILSLCGCGEVGKNKTKQKLSVMVGFRKSKNKNNWIYCTVLMWAGYETSQRKKDRFFFFFLLYCLYVSSLWCECVMVGFRESQTPVQFTMLLVYGVFSVWCDCVILKPQLNWPYSLFVISLWYDCVWWWASESSKSWVYDVTVWWWALESSKSWVYDVTVCGGELQKAPSPEFMVWLCVMVGFRKLQVLSLLCDCVWWWASESSKSWCHCVMVGFWKAESASRCGSCHSLHPPGPEAAGSWSGA